MASSRYPDGFCALFIAQLEAHGRPRYPQAQWFVALRVADYQMSLVRVRRSIKVEEGRKLYIYQHEQGIADRSREMYELDERCSRFLRSRGLETPLVSAWTRAGTA